MGHKQTTLGAGFLKTAGSKLTNYKENPMFWFNTCMLNYWRIFYGKASFQSAEKEIIQIRVRSMLTNKHKARHDSKHIKFIWQIRACLFWHYWLDISSKTGYPTEPDAEK